MDTCICMAESLCCSPETVTPLLIGYTSIQNKRFFLICGFWKKVWNDFYLGPCGPRINNGFLKILDLVVQFALQSLCPVRLCRYHWTLSICSLHLPGWSLLTWPHRWTGVLLAFSLLQEGENKRVFRGFRSCHHRELESREVFVSLAFQSSKPKRHLQI